MSTTDRTIMTAMQYKLLELPNGGDTWPSNLWTRDEVLAALNERQNRMLKEAQMEVGIANLPVFKSQHRFKLPDDWLTTVDLVWFGSDHAVSVLDRSDSFEADHGQPYWPVEDAAAPLVYMDEESPTLFVQIAPAPNIDGMLQLLYIPQGAELNGVGTGELSVLPDEYALPGLMYGALADLLQKDGRGKDTIRSQYCEDRYRFAMQIARIMLKGWV